MKVTLTKLPAIDLSIRYARQMGEENGKKKIRHYIVYPETYTAQPTKNGFEIVKEFILKSENFEPSEIDFFDDTYLYEQDGETLDAAEILAYHPDILKSLNKIKTNSSTCHVTSYYASKMDSFKAKLCFKLNAFIDGLNIVIDKIHNLTIFEGFNGNGVYLPYFVEPQAIRVFNPVAYLSVSHESSDFFEAKDLLVQDLQKLHDSGLILGSLAGPSQFKLADYVGSGNDPTVIFCFPVIDLKRAEQILGKIDNQYDFLKHFGIKTQQGFESGINYLNGPFEKKYIIEEVIVDKPKEEEKAPTEVIPSILTGSVGFTYSDGTTFESIQSVIKKLSKPTSKKKKKVTKKKTKKKKS